MFDPVTGRPPDGVTYGQNFTPLHADTGESVGSWVRILAVLAMGRSHAESVTERFRLIRTADSQIVPPVQIRLRGRQDFKRVTWRLAGQQVRGGNAIFNQQLET